MEKEKDYEIRRIKSDDYPNLIKWWKLYEEKGIKIPPPNLLPNKGLGGFVVEKNGRLVASCFLYFTNSAMGYVDFLLADPTYREDDRHDLVLELGVFVTKIAVGAGCEMVWALCANSSLLDLAKNPSTEAKGFNMLDQKFNIIYTYNATSE